jgi:prepilin-type N-terminal cleavage/methylation domain-containing protein
MIKLNQQSGMTAVEVLITLFIAAAFLMSGYQLYSLIIKDNGEARALAKATNVAYDYLQQQKATTISGASNHTCAASTPYTDSPITVEGLVSVTRTVVVSCPYTAVTSIAKIQVTIKYGNDSPQKSITNTTYVKL